MFDGLSFPTLRSSRPARMELDGLDPINRELMALWPSSQGGGRTTNSIAKVPGAQGTLVNGATWSVSPKGRALNLAGTNEYVQVENGRAVDLSGGISTVSFWVKGVAASQVANAAFIAKGTGSNNWGLYRDNATNNLNIYTANDTQTTKFVGCYSSIINGLMNSAVWVQNTGNASLYINGALFATQPLASPNNTSSPFFIGAGWSGVVPFIGQMNNVRIWKRALLPSEIRRLYADPWAGTFDPADRLFASARAPVISSASWSAPSVWM